MHVVGLAGYGDPVAKSLAPVESVDRRARFAMDLNQANISDETLGEADLLTTFVLVDGFQFDGTVTTVYGVHRHIKRHPDV